MRRFATVAIRSDVANPGRYVVTRSVNKQWFLPEEFEAIVSDALDSLPKRFADLLENIVVTIEDEPDEDDLDETEDPDGELLGIYRGVSLVERMNEPPLLPDEIAIFRGPVSRVSRTRDEAVQEIRDTVIHEIGHYFGLEDEDLP